jgi:hypothetical protein
LKDHFGVAARVCGVGGAGIGAAVGSSLPLRERRGDRQQVLHGSLKNPSAAV